MMIVVVVVVLMMLMLMLMLMRIEILMMMMMIILMVCCGKRGKLDVVCCVLALIEWGLLGWVDVTVWWR